MVMLRGSDGRFFRKWIFIPLVFSVLCLLVACSVRQKSSTPTKVQALVPKLTAQESKLPFTREQLSSPVGYWLVADPSSKKSYGVVQFYLHKEGSKQELRGKVLAVVNIPPKEWKRKTCTGCAAPWTNRPIIGLTFLWNYQKSGPEWDAPWINGKLFNFTTKDDIYRTKLWLTDKGMALKLRCYYFFLFYTISLPRIDHKETMKYVRLMQQQMKKYS